MRRELKAEVLRLRAVQDGIERQSSGRRRLMNSGTFNNENTEEVQKKQREIDKLRDQLKRTEEQLNVTQKYALLLNTLCSFNLNFRTESDVRRYRREENENLRTVATCVANLVVQFFLCHFNW